MGQNESLKVDIWGFSEDVEIRGVSNLSKEFGLVYEFYTNNLSCLHKMYVHSH